MGISGGIVANEAVNWLTTIRDKSKPFFLYVAFNEPHEPIATDPRYRALYEKRHPDDPIRVACYGNVTQMDDALGRILRALEAQGLAENTLVWFTSDNGPARTKWHNAGSSGGFREFKGHRYQGGLRVLRMAPTPQHTAFLMKGFEEAYRGREMAGLPNELLQAMAASGQSPLILKVRQGDAAAVKEALATVENKKARLDERLLYTRVFGEVRNDDTVRLLLAIAAGNEPVTLRKAALISLMAYDRKEIGTQATVLLTKTTGEVRTATLALLASRAAWSVDLLQSIQAGGIPASAVPTDIVDRIRGHHEKDVAALVAKVFPPVAAKGGTEWTKRIAEVEAILKKGTGNPYQGEAGFMERCASCHKLFFKGGKIGPELTSYQRDNLGTMLISIINPNAEIREGFQYYRVQSRDGRSLSGFLVERDAQILVLRGLEGEDITLRQSEVKELQPIGRSLMPEGLLDNLDDTRPPACN